MMRLSLSVRVAESFRNKREAVMSLDELAGLAAAEGYHALCMRASQLGTQTALEVVREKRRKLLDLGLRVSMVTGDFAIPENSDEAPQALRNITPYLELAEALQADLLRIGIKRVEDIGWAQRSADEAHERGMRLAHQSHTSSPFETLAGSLETLKRIDRRNFGVIYEPANLELCGEDYGSETIKRLSPFLFNVYVQNHVLNPDGQDVIATWAKGEVRFDRIPVWEEGGIDFPPVMGTLEEIGYEGYVTVHQASVGEGGVEEAVRESARYLRSLAEFDG